MWPTTMEAVTDDRGSLINVKQQAISTRGINKRNCKTQLKKEAIRKPFQTPGQKTKALIPKSSTSKNILQPLICDICDELFTSKQELISHICSHEDLDYFCTKCEETYCDEETFRQHKEGCKNMFVWTTGNSVVTEKAEGSEGSSTTIKSSIDTEKDLKCGSFIMNSAVATKEKTVTECVHSNIFTTNHTTVNTDKEKGPENSPAMTCKVFLTNKEKLPEGRPFKMISKINDVINTTNKIEPKCSPSKMSGKMKGLESSSFEMISKINDVIITTNKIEPKCSPSKMSNKINDIIATNKKGSICSPFIMNSKINDVIMMHNKKGPECSPLKIISKINDVTITTNKKVPDCSQIFLNTKINGDSSAINTNVNTKNHDVVISKKEKRPELSYNHKIKGDINIETDKATKRRTFNVNTEIKDVCITRNITVPECSLISNNATHNAFDTEKSEGPKCSLFNMNTKIHDVITTKVKGPDCSPIVTHAGITEEDHEHGQINISTPTGNFLVNHKGNEPIPSSVNISKTFGAVMNDKGPEGSPINMDIETPTMIKKEKDSHEVIHIKLEPEDQDNREKEPNRNVVTKVMKTAYSDELQDLVSLAEIMLKAPIKLEGEIKTERNPEPVTEHHDSVANDNGPAITNINMMESASNIVHTAVVENNNMLHQSIITNDTATHSEIVFGKENNADNQHNYSYLTNVPEIPATDTQYNNVYATNVTGIPPSYNQTHNVYADKVSAIPATDTQYNNVYATNVSAIPPAYNQTNNVYADKVSAIPATDTQYNNVYATNVTGIPPSYNQTHNVYADKVSAIPATDTQYNNVYATNVSAIPPAYNQTNNVYADKVSAIPATDTQYNNVYATNVTGIPPSYNQTHNVYADKVSAIPATDTQYNNVYATNVSAIPPAYNQTNNVYADKVSAIPATDTQYNNVYATNVTGIPPSYNQTHNVYADKVSAIPAADNQYSNVYATTVPATPAAYNQNHNVYVTLTNVPAISTAHNQNSNVTKVPAIPTADNQYSNVYATKVPATPVAYNQNHKVYVTLTNVPAISTAHNQNSNVTKVPAIPTADNQSNNFYVTNVPAIPAHIAAYNNVEIEQERADQDFVDKMMVPDTFLNDEGERTVGEPGTNVDTSRSMVGHPRTTAGQQSVFTVSDVFNESPKSINWYCGECKKRFCSKSILTLHFRSNHKQTELCSCAVCNNSIPPPLIPISSKQSKTPNTLNRQITSKKPDKSTSVSRPLQTEDLPTPLLKTHGNPNRRKMAIQKKDITYCGSSQTMDRDNEMKQQRHVSGMLQTAKDNPSFRQNSFLKQQQKNVLGISKIIQNKPNLKQNDLIKKPADNPDPKQRDWLLKQRDFLADSWGMSKSSVDKILKKKMLATSQNPKQNEMTKQRDFISEKGGMLQAAKDNQSHTAVEPIDNIIKDEIIDINSNGNNEMKIENSDYLEYDFDSGVHEANRDFNYAARHNTAPPVRANKLINVKKIPKGRQRQEKQKPGKQHFCEICLKQFKRRDVLKIHMETHGDKKVQCPNCDRLFNRTPSMLRHKQFFCKAKTNTETYTCDRCHSNFVTRGTLNNHKYRCYDKTQPMPFECDVCKKGFPDLSILAFHKKKHSKTLTCDICGKNFYDRSHITRHLLAHGGVKPYKCRVCKKRYASKDKLQNHMTSHTNTKATCDQCGKGFVSKGGLRGHLKDTCNEAVFKLKPFTCDVCKKRYVNKTGLTRHITNNHVRQFKCDICDKSFGLLCKLVTHLNLHNENKVHCVVCKKRFSRRDLLYHERKHAGWVKQYFCDTCDQKFIHHTSLFCHSKSCRRKPQANSHRCHVCDMKFPSKTAWAIHMEICKNVYECDVCKREFHTKRAFATHIRRHSKKVICDVCDQSFEMKTNLIYHLGRDHKAIRYKDYHRGTKKYSCDTCGKKYRLKSSLSLHKKCHRLGKKYCCPKCGEKFTFKYELSNHMQRDCNKKEVKGKKRSIKTLVSSKIKTDNDRNEVVGFDCATCDAKFSDKTALSYHKLHGCGKKRNQQNNVL